MKRGMKIAISGKSGCGNTTISKMVADALSLAFINFTFRSLAHEHNLDLRQILDLAASDTFWDREVDSRQVRLARESSGCVLGSRLAIWMLPEADLKVYLKARPETRAKRIQKREGGTLAEVREFTEERDRQDRSRYMQIYNLDNDNYDFADLVIDTDDYSPEQIAEIIIARAQEQN
jgi:cytidylate kinase